MKRAIAIRTCARRVKFCLFRHSFLIFLGVLGIVVFVIVYWFCEGVKEAEGPWRTMLTVAGSSLLGLYFLQKQQLEETRLMKELITEFNGRYDKLNGWLAKITETASSRLSPRQEEAVIDYFNLCAEEYLFYDLGYLDPRVWKAWRNGMKKYAEDPRIQKLWDREPKRSYYGFQFPQADHEDEED